MKMKLVITFYIFLLVCFNHHEIPSSTKNNRILIPEPPQSSGEYDNIINIDKMNFTIFEPINVVFNISYYPYPDQFFSYVFSETIEYSGKIYESERILANFSILDNYTFNIINYKLNFSENFNTYYIILMLHNDGASPWAIEFENSAITIEKAKMTCKYNLNNTQIEYNDIFMFEFQFISSFSDHYLYNNSKVYFFIEIDNLKVKNETLSFTNAMGKLNISFVSRNHSRIGFFNLIILINGSSFFQDFSASFMIEVMQKQIFMKVSEKSPNFLYVNRNFETNILYPIFIEFYDYYGDLYYDSDINPKINYNSSIYESIDQLNGTYYCGLILDNIEQKSELNVSLNIEYYIVENISLMVNVSKRNLGFECLFPSPLNYSSIMDLSLYFKIFDEFDSSYVYNLKNNCNLQYYHNNEWHTLENNPDIYNQMYRFTISNKSMLDLKEKIIGSLLFKIVFIGNQIYHSTNSSIFNIEVNSKNNEDPTQNPVLKQSFMINIFIIVSFLIIPVPIFISFKKISRNLKKKYRIREIKIKV